MARVKQRRRSTRASTTSSEERPEAAALCVFALLVVLAPLAFGAVDRIVQLGALALLTVGFLLRPPELALGRPGRWAVLGVGVVLVVSQFAPAVLFGATRWRPSNKLIEPLGAARLLVLPASFELPLPWTHHPEPGLAVDALLALAVAAAWFCWVRTLAGWRPNRTALAWMLFSAAAIVAGVSLLTRTTSESHLIFGYRETPGWRGFGPFPNRNHTACFLAMGALMGAGCTIWAAARRRFGLMAAGLGLLVLIMAGLRASQSRGGLIALGVGAVVLMLLILARLPTRRTLAALAAATLVICGLGLAFGGPMLGRFNNQDARDSNQARRDIWHDAAGMWRDAPLFGHGLGSFASLFPLYEERVELDNEIVLHPESSWLLWLTELGLVPVAAGALALAVFVGRQRQALFARQQGFFTMASGLSVLAGLLAHSLVDVPAHRWGTAGFALAALALAAPRYRRRPEPAGEDALPEFPGRVAVAGGTRRWALLPLGVAAFWALPFLTGGPAWSPTTLGRVLARASASPAEVSGAEMEQELAAFPLHPKLHQLRGLQLLADRTGSDRWLGHFRLAARLSPGSWWLTRQQAQACMAVAPGYALSFWQDTVDRGGFRRAELFGSAVGETRALPGAAGVWGSYVSVHPELALQYARLVPPEEGRRYFELWWQQRALPARSLLSQTEVEAFYNGAGTWATPEQLHFWMDRMAARAPQDYLPWARLLHSRGEEAEAWALLARWRPDPPWPAAPETSLAQLERRYLQSPENVVIAQDLATRYHQQHNEEGERRILREALQHPGAPVWFTRKAAWLEASEGRQSEAVAIMLRESAP